jgi:2-methylisocitrate lyase-like PEP mutase family enzyme
MTLNQTEKGIRFRKLHEEPEAFVIANVWDAGSARVISGLGFKALATSSGASANVLGRLDGNVTRDEALDHAGRIAMATDLPVSADLEKGFGDAPEMVAETIRLAAATGLVGCTIEDATGDKQKPIYEIEFAIERIRAAVETARSLPFTFTLTARSENFLRSIPDLNDTIKRLQAFEAAGADVLFAPGLPDLAAVQSVCAAVSKPVNFMVGIKGKSFTVAELQQAGVKRISLAASLYRAGMSGLIEAALEIRGEGTFSYLDRAVTAAELNELISAAVKVDKS